MGQSQGVGGWAGEWAGVERNKKDSAGKCGCGRGLVSQCEGGRASRRLARVGKTCS